jgi:hypothetical protein
MSKAIKPVKAWGIFGEPCGGFRIEQMWTKEDARQARWEYDDVNALSLVRVEISVIAPKKKVRK